MLPPIETGQPGDVHLPRCQQLNQADKSSKANLKRIELLAGWSNFRQLLVQRWPEVRQSIQILDERAAYSHVQRAHPCQPLRLDTSVPPRLCTASLPFESCPRRRFRHWSIAEELAQQLPETVVVTLPRC